MKYMGSKNRHAKDIIPIILSNREGRCYVEPFVGGFNLIDKVDGNRIANDTHFYLIELFKAIQGGWIPPSTVSEEHYAHIKANKEHYLPHFVGFVGFGCSYSGKWFGGYARGNASNGTARNYCLESKRNILQQSNKIKGIDIRRGDYWTLEIPDNSIIYCDPPYYKTTKYETNEFDHAEFWDWARLQALRGHRIFISEYTAPSDFICVWSKLVNNTLAKDTGSKQGMEKLFTIQ
jgi:DNA adenine methylase